MPSDICILLGQRIRELRTAKGWRQIDLAEEAGINENYVSDIEIGKKEICLRTMQAVADAFGLTLAELLKGL
ncbi:MAG: helix-turn-helix transcriptional regulator [Terriglobales bacterium]|jgi:XRE family aerobic/anaerobic benzoate catabolism transcriptional regulator